MTKKRIIYGVYRSPAVRAVLMALEALELDYKFEAVDIQSGELKKPEFLKKNPQHTVPILEEDDKICLWDSHAIMAYLVRKYGKNDSLYPKDYYQRAIVDQRLHYENGVLFVGLLRYELGSIIHGTAKKDQIPQMAEKINEAYKLLEKDFSIVTSFTALLCVVPLESTKFPELSAWFKRMKELPYYDAVNANGTKSLHELLKEKIAEIK